MMLLQNPKKFKFIILVSSILLFATCVEPIEPEFDFQEGLISVEAFVSTAQGASFATVKESIFDINLKQYRNVFVNGAQVSFVNTDTGTTVLLAEDEDFYLPPNDFVASVGDTWELDITLNEGAQYKSKPETIIEPVAISDVSATYDPQFIYREGVDEYVPGHLVSVNFNDPPNMENYYYWNFRSFETREICSIVDDIALLCETDCWFVRYNENIKIFSDEFANGSTVNEPVADVLLFTKEDILVEIQQFSLSKPAYDYYKVLKDIIEGSGGLNAPTPAPLIGNIFNPNNEDEYVLGRFTAASTSTANIFIQRNDVEENQIITPVSLEEQLGYPCIESRYVTRIRPEDWP